MSYECVHEVGGGKERKKKLSMNKMRVLGVMRPVLKSKAK